MKILVICQYYSPEPFRIADICEALVKEGNEVDVVTSFPNYPMGEIYEGYKNGEHKDEKINGVYVHRVFTIGRKTGTLYRFINYYTYSIASMRYVSKLKKEYDVVFVYQLSPVMMAEAALRYKKRFGKKVVLYCLDLWPESLTLGGIKKDGLIYSYYKKLSEKIYGNVDKIMVSSRMFAGYLKDVLNIENDKIQYLPQYAEDVFYLSDKRSADSVNITFAGNIGTTQSIETILYAAQKLKDKNIHFNFYGDGSGFDTMVSLSQKLQLENVTFHGRVPIEALPEKYAKSDALIVTLSDNAVLSMSFPGKIQSYMAAGKPIVAALNGEAARIISEADCGFVSSAEDVDGLVCCIEKLMCADKALLGKNSRAYYEKCFQKEAFINKLLEILAE
ncbi:MAG: glycosyltransferase family 4 protein [Acutalibacteraceae bacterium]|nr:glycosyltransferase family 4 protein [Acutalibacteraceae bacterium]